MRTTSAEWTPWLRASLQAASTAASPSRKHRGEDIDHLAIAIVLASEFAPDALHGGRQQPVLEGRAIAKSAGFTDQYRHVMPGIVDRLATAEGTAMLGDNPPVLADDDAVGIGLDLDWPPDGAR